MPVYKLPEKIVFPHAKFAEADGLLAIGGDLSEERLLTAYANGIFPWYTEDSPILWWSPDPRMVIFPEKFKRSKSLRRTVEKGVFEVRFDSDFESVIRNCGIAKRPEQEGSWITGEMLEAYIALHKLGYAHSVETFYEGKLVGGLYGVSIGKVFFGESMFHHKTDASKVALWHLVDKLTEWDFDFIDAQQETDHLKSLGAEAIERKKFLNLLEIAVQKEGIVGSWNKLT